MLRDCSKQGLKNGEKNTIQSTEKQNFLSADDDEQLEVHGFVSNRFKNILINFFYLFSIGILRLLFHWYPEWQLKATHSSSSLDKATKVLIVDHYKDKFKSSFVKDVKIVEAHSKPGIISCVGGGGKKLLTAYLADGTKRKLSKIRTITFKKLKYIWDEDTQNFVKLAGLDRCVTNQELKQCNKGYSKEEQQLNRIIYGNNEITVPEKSIPTLIVLEALTPFYIFQVFSLIVWFAESYYYYTGAIIAMSVFGIATSVIQTRRNQANLKGTVNSKDEILVCRGEEFEKIPTTDLVPGDVIAVPNGEMQCDAVLLNGSCIVNESMLTGESVPVTKNALPHNNKPFDIKENAANTLFCGTNIIQTRYYGNEKVLAVVIRTGYLTTKGQLVRSILYPPPADFKFDQDSYKFIIMLSVIAFGGFLYTIFYKFSRNIDALDIVIKALDLVTIAIPPALPAAMTVGKLYAISRLKKNQIFCINSRVINVSGSVDCICFDKTGTLTEDGLDMWGIVNVDKNEITLHESKEIPHIPPSNPLIQGMLACHSLTLINNELCGDPLDVKMFESTEAILEEPNIEDCAKFDLLVPHIAKKGSKEIAIIHQYQFSSTLQRMSVVGRNLENEHFEVFCKGAPEVIFNLSHPESVPESIKIKLKEYTEQGYRVIGVGTKTLKENFHKITKMHREEIECDLTFCGLIILENRLKPQTTSIIKTLKDAGMKIVMITGDNAQTAVSVAHECGILDRESTTITVTYSPTKSLQFLPESNKIQTQAMGDVELGLGMKKYHLVLDGRTWNDIRQFVPESIPKIITKGAVFARMSSTQKQQLVEKLQGLGYYVAMCGDGANDCGALRAAHVGISLSEAEASVASPFTSKEANIGCTVKVIREGRAALVTSIGVFKMMICYSLTEFAAAIMLYAMDLNLTMFQYLYIDICLILFFASFFGKTKSYSELHKTRPKTSLLSLIPIASIVLFMSVTIIFQNLSLQLIRHYSWFEPFIFDSTNVNYFTSYEDYAIFTMSMFQYITMAFVFSKGKPFRKPIFTNIWFSFSLILMTIISCYITIYPAQWLMDLLELKLPPKLDASFIVLALAAGNFIICWFFEDIFVEIFLNKLVKTVRWLRKIRKMDEIEREIREQNWPFEKGIVNNAFDKMETTRC